MARRNAGVGAGGGGSLASDWLARRPGPGVGRTPAEPARVERRQRAATLTGCELLCERPGTKVNLAPLSL